MLNIPAVILLLSAAGPVTAAEPLFLSAPPPAAAGLGETAVFRPAAGYHFNLKAPQECGAAKAFDVSKAALKCRFTAAGDQEVSLKVCDDANTGCMSVDFTVKVSGAAKKPAPRPAPAAAGQAGLEGFMLNVPGAALELAKKEHKLLFVDFFGRWCPPCRVMEDTVLWQPAFMDATRDMVRLSLDVDRPESREWRKRFGVSGYPTYLVADEDLNEIGRWVGSGNLAAFAAWLAEQERWRGLPLAKAEAGIAGLDEAGRLRLARQYMVLEKWKEARSVLAGIGTRAAAYLDAQAMAKEETSTDTARLSALYSGLLERFDGRDGQPAEASSLEWISALHKADPAAAKPYIDGLNGLIASLISSKDAAAEGYGPEDVLYGAASAMDDAGRADLAAPLYARAAGAYGELADKAPRAGLAKGLRLSQGRCLAAAGQYEAAAAVYSGLAGKFPAEYAFHRSYAGVLLKMKKYPEALREARLAERLSYGDIHSQIVLLRARIQAESGDRAGAVKGLRAAIAAAEKPGSEDGPAGGMKKYLKELEPGN